MAMNSYAQFIRSLWTLFVSRIGTKYALIVLFLATIKTTASKDFRIFRKKLLKNERSLPKFKEKNRFLLKMTSLKFMSKWKIKSSQKKTIYWDKCKWNGSNAMSFFFDQRIKLLKKSKILAIRFKNFSLLLVQY